MIRVHQNMFAHDDTWDPQELAQASAVPGAGLQIAHFVLVTIHEYAMYGVPPLSAPLVFCFCWKSARQ